MTWVYPAIISPVQKKDKVLREYLYPDCYTINRCKDTK